MKIFTLAFIASAQAINFTYNPNAEFNARREELAKAQQDRLTTQWQNRIDNYDPDIDQEYASMILNAEKRHQQILKLRDRVAKSSWWSPNYETDRFNLKVLEAEQKEYEAKAASQDHSEFGEPPK